MDSSPHITKIASPPEKLNTAARTAEEEGSPYKDLAGQVKKLEAHYFEFGGASEIYKGIWEDPESKRVVKVAIKVLRGVHIDPEKLKVTIRRLNGETRIWHSLSHENVLPFLGICSDMGACPSMISPLCDNGDIYKYLRKDPPVDPPVDRLAIILGVAHGIEYLHSKNVVHGDLKGTNVLISDDGIPLLTDFGRSQLLDKRGFTTSFKGSVRYLAPELLMGESEHDLDETQTGQDHLENAYEASLNEPIPTLTKPTDVYAFSMVVLDILTGKIPFAYTKSDHVITARVQKGGRPVREKCSPTTFTDPMWTLLTNCWDQHPDQRPEMRDVVKRLKRCDVWA